MHVSFLAYRRFEYLKYSLALIGVSVITYALHDPSVPPNGGTWLGYTLGTVGAALIFWLLWFGVRKRQYHSHLGQLSGWLSAHVYLGSALLVVATLHCGFQFGWNVHTLSYVLMVLVIISGMYGVFTYAYYPARLTQNRAGMGIEPTTMLREVADLDRRCLKIADQMGDKVHQMILRSIERTQLGASLWRNALGGVGKMLGDLAEELKADVGRSQLPLPPLATPILQQGGEMTVMYVANQFASAGADQVQELLDLINAKKVLVTRVQDDLRYHTLMSVWRNFHVILSIALLAALIAHVVSVFFYW